MFNPQQKKGSGFRIPFQCIWLKINGSWPLESDQNLKQGSLYRRFWFAWVYNVWAWYVVISVGITICFQTAFLISHFGDIIMLTENCCTTFMGVLNLIRLLHLRLNQRRFREIIQKFVDDIWIPDNAHLVIAKKCRERMKTFRVMTMLLSCLILMYCVLPIVELFVIIGIDSTTKPFPYKMQFPYNPFKNWVYYVLTYIFTAYAGICVVTTLFAEDSFLGFFITYTCGQFCLLHERIDNLMATTRQKVSSKTNLKEFQKSQVQELKCIAHQHNKLICFAQLLEDFFNPILLVNLLISALLICMVGFQLVTGKNMFIGDYVKFVIYISSAISQLYILCGNGDTLIQHSTKTAWHLYNCNWEATEKISTNTFNTNTEFKTSLLFMILCSQRPVRITALKFSTLSFQSFSAILSTSMSYFTLLRSLYFDNPK